MENLNVIIDGIIILILFTALVTGAKRGFIMNIFRMSSSLISLVLATFFHPIVTKLIRMTPLFDVLKNYVADKLDITISSSLPTQAEQTTLIHNLPIPDFLSDMLIENNNSVVNGILDTHSITDYICSYIANLIVSVVTTLVLVALLRVIFRVLTKALRIVSRLPIIHQLNFLGGSIVGLGYGVLIVWVILLASMVFVASDWYSVFLNGIDTSILGKFLYDNNLIRNLLMGDLF